MYVSDYTWRPPTPEQTAAIERFARLVVPDYDRKIRAAKARMNTCKRRNGASSAESASES